jgi:hypothetical protein
MTSHPLHVTTCQKMRSDSGHVTTCLKKTGSQNTSDFTIHITLVHRHHLILILVYVTKKKKKNTVFFLQVFYFFIQYSSFTDKTYNLVLQIHSYNIYYCYKSVNFIYSRVLAPYPLSHLRLCIFICCLSLSQRAKFRSHISHVYFFEAWIKFLCRLSLSLLAKVRPHNIQIYPL